MRGRRILVLYGPSHLTKKGDRLCVLKETRTASYPVRHLDCIIVFGNISFSTEAVHFIVSNSIYVFFLSRFGRIKGMIVDVFLRSNNHLRIHQYRKYVENRTHIAKLIVRGKLEEVKNIYRINIDSYLRKLEDAKDIDEIMGIEGAISRSMFDTFSKNIRGADIDFKGRSYKPPADEVNALLSLAYTLTYCVAFPVVVSMGFDPYISFLHSKRGTHASFCSDVIEPLRPFVTKSLEDPIRRKVFVKGDFKKDGNGFYLHKESFGKFMNWFEGIKEDLTDRLQETLLYITEELK